MKITVRYGTFETNSSSTHSLVICTAEEYEMFRSGKLFPFFVNYQFDGMVTEETAAARIEENEKYYNSPESRGKPYTSMDYATYIDEEIGVRSVSVDIGEGKTVTTYAFVAEIPS